MRVVHKNVFKILFPFALLAASAYGVLIFASRELLIVDGQSIVHYSLSKGTVGDLLELYNVRLSSKDIVQPALFEKLRWGERVRVVRVSESEEKKSEEIDFILDWKRRTSKNLRKVEIQNGHRKRTTWLVKKIFHDGKEFKVEKKLKKFVKIPVQRLVFLGERGRAEKSYDLSRVKRMRMIATAYWEGDPQVPGVITFSGHRVQRGMVAVDPQVIPLSSRLYIPGYGYAYASDTGSAIKGNRIDLFVESRQASRKWEYVNVDVYILEKAKKW